MGTGSDLTSSTMGRSVGLGSTRWACVEGKVIVVRHRRWLFLRCMITVSEEDYICAIKQVSRKGSYICRIVQELRKWVVIQLLLEEI